MTDETALSLTQQAALSSGANFWFTKAVADIPAIMLTDGPHGLRKQAGTPDRLDVSESVPATCFPPAAGLAQSWDVGLVHRIGEALGRECRAEGVSVLLGPGLNLRRSPLCGRNFEYFSEDPVLTAALGTAWVTGVQSQQVGASPKHFAFNEQETDRMRVSADVDARSMRELYLRAFQRVVTEAKPWTVMASYNRVNGVHVTESEHLLTQVLRGQWGFDGVVVSDWGAVVDAVAAAAAGLDLQMPSTGEVSDRQLLDAVHAGTLCESVLDRIAERMARLASRSHHGIAVAADLDAHHELARAAAAQSIVLLRNEHNVLPLAPDTAVAVVGDFALTPRYQGGGSSVVNAARVDIPLHEIRAVSTGGVSFARGFALDGTGDAEALRAEAVRIAGDAEVAVLFLGLPEGLESEGWDRTDISLPDDQLALAREVLRANTNVVVVLSHGGVVDVTPVLDVAAILDTALTGQGGGHALAQILFGLANPCGHLAETIPLRLADTPSYLDFPGEHGHTRYGEGLFVGYRWYDSRDLEVAFAFGHGLSYTSFDLSDLQLAATGDGITARVTVTNTGARAGRAVPQFYVSVPDSHVIRPARELKGFTNVHLEAGASASVEVLLHRQDLAYWDTRIDDWALESGDYVVAAGLSSRALLTQEAIHLDGNAPRLPLTMESTIGEVLQRPRGPALLQTLLSEAGNHGAQRLFHDLTAFLTSVPIGRLSTFSGSPGMNEALEGILATLDDGQPARLPDRP